MNSILQILVACAVLIVAWWITERFSPDELLTKIIKLVIFIIAIFLIITRLLPMVGVSF